MSALAAPSDSGKNKGMIPAKSWISMKRKMIRVAAFLFKVELFIKDILLYVLYNTSNLTQNTLFFHKL